MTVKDLKSYQILNEKHVKELNSEGILLEHKKTGARVFLLSNDDENKVFCIGLRPAIVGLVGAAALLLMNGENFSTPANPWHFYISIALFFATFIGVKVMKINPIRMILYSAFAGLVLLY